MIVHRKEKAVSKYTLEVRYRLRAHDCKEFERILDREVIPLAAELGLTLGGVWKSVTGKVGEYVEHWEFNSLEEFENDWNKLINDSRLQEVFKTTGPMVEDETFTLLAPFLED